jgi:hypothetical protein
MNKTLFRILIVLLNFGICSADWKEQSEYKGKGILANTAIVQFEKGIYDSISASQILNDPDVIIEEQILKAFQTELMNSGNRFFKLNNIDNNSILKTEEKLLRTFVISYKGNIDPNKFCFYLKKKYPKIENAEPYGLQEIQKQFIPNDPKTSQQRVLFNSKVFEAWGVNQGNPKIIIGISDDGTNQNHEDIKGSLFVNDKDPIDGIDNDKDGYIDNYNGYNFFPENQFDWSNTRNDDDHGTLTAGIIGATFDNGLGMAGIAGRCSIFPLKIAKTGKTSLGAGYTSLLFAAQKGFSVVNCSWANKGNPNYSTYYQNVLDYAVAKNLAVVSVSGNIEGNVNLDKYRTRYPGGLIGALGVGEVDEDDILTSNTSLGSHCNILAQGIGNVSLANTLTGNTNCSSGTSFASPVVAGALGIVRSQFPNLNALQAIQHIRQSIDDISSINFNNKNKMPGRLNLQKALEIDPFSHPGFHRKEVVILDMNNQIKQYYSIGDEVKLLIKSKNVLGSASNVKFKLSLAWAEDTSAASILLDEVNFSKIEANQDFDLGHFLLKVNGIGTSKFVYRIDITADNNYRDLIFVDFNPIPEVLTFKNDAITFSAGIAGTFGFNTSFENRQGYGFSLNGFGDALYEGGLVATIDDKNVLSANNGFGNESNDFKYSEPYLAPVQSIKVIGKFDNSDSIEIQQKIYTPTGNNGFTKIEIKATNKSSKVFNNLSIGYKMDWDVGYEFGYTKNQAELFDESIPVKIKGINTAANYVKAVNDSITFGTAVTSYESGAIAQLANLNSNHDYSDTDIIKALNSGTTFQETAVTDISGIVGMRYPGELKQGESKVCFICIAGAKNKNEYKSNITNCLNSLTSIDDVTKIDFSLNPNPVINSLKINSSLNNYSLDILNGLGQIVISQKELSGNQEIDLLNLINGFYIIKLYNDKVSKFEKFIKAN